VGSFSENPGDTRNLGNAFRDAYADALIRGLPLRGVLGSDRVHPWPGRNPESWSQNWAGEGREPNSWGIPELFLALGVYRPENPLVPDTVVYTVYGRILDLYGRSAGYSRANGAAGYGAPLGEIFLENGEVIQRFSRGRIVLDGGDGRFIPRDDPFMARLRDLTIEEIDGEFSGPGIPPEAVWAFARAWAFAFSEGGPESDGPLLWVPFSRPWILQSEGNPVSALGFYLKTYNQGRYVFTAAAAKELPLRAFLISGPVLAVLLDGKRIPGTEGLRPLGRISGGNDFTRSLAAGFAFYGLPLSGVLPWPPGGTGEGPWEEAQRFSKGWIIVHR
jgi:hypothetical protein